MNYLGEVWRPANRLPKEGQEVLVQCVWENGSIGYKECQFLNNQFVFFKPDGRGYYLTAVNKWIPMPSNAMVDNEKNSSNHIPIECVYPYLIRELHESRKQLKAMEEKFALINDEVNRYTQDNSDKSEYIDKINRKIEDVRQTYISLKDNENRFKQVINELLK